MEYKKADLAVIISNGDYRRHAKDIPDVLPAYADGEAMKHFLMSAAGIKAGDIIHLKDATNAQMSSVFGNERSHKGQLFNWTRQGISNVYIYFRGSCMKDKFNKSVCLVSIYAIKIDKKQARNS